ncbi:TonB-dependent receptor [Pseudomonas aeruginosa]|nr:TonB-dependent receptor [Pseudomonas aeruginosa]
MAVFYNKYRDFIDEDALNTDSTGGNGQTFQSNNIERAVIKGVELRAAWSWAPSARRRRLYTQGSVAYAYGRNKDNGEPINSVNPLTGVFGLSYGEADGNYGGLLSWTLVKRKDRVDGSTFTPRMAPPAVSRPRLRRPRPQRLLQAEQDLTLNAGLYNLTDKKCWLWDDVRGYDSVGEASALAPANIDRLSQPGRNFAVNLVWDI